MKRTKRSTKSKERGGPLSKKSVEYFRQTWIRHVSFPDIVACKDQQDVPPPKYRSDFDKERSLLKASITASKRLKELQANAAAGERLAMGMLLGHVEDLVQWLEDVSYRREEFLQSYARKSACWPMLVALRPKRMQEIRAHLKRLGVATQSEIRADEKTQWGIAKNRRATEKGYSTATIYALAMVDTIRCNQKRLPIAKILSKRELRADWKKIPQWAKDCPALPPLTKGTAAKWFKIGWQALLEKTNGHPEDVPELRALGGYREFHSEFSGQQKTVTPRTAAVNIRTGIKDRIAQALHSLAHSGNSPA